MAWSGYSHRPALDEQDSTGENQSFIRSVFSSLLGGKFTQQQKMAAQPDQQRRVTSQPTSKNSPRSLQKLHEMGPKKDIDHDWEHLDHPDKQHTQQGGKTAWSNTSGSDIMIPPQSTDSPLVDSHQVDADNIKRKHHEGVQDGVQAPQTSREGDGELTEHEKQLMEAIDDRTAEKSQLATEKHQLQEAVDKQNKEILHLRDEVKQLVTTLEKQAAWMKQLKSDSAKEASEDHTCPESTTSSEQEVGLKQHISELESELDRIKKHSKGQSRTILELKQEAHGAEMLQEQEQSYYGLLEAAEEREGRLQKGLSIARSELETVTKYKECVEKELLTSKQEAFRVSQENEELRDKIIQFSASIEAENDLQRKIYKLENENAELQNQLESAQAQVLGFKSDFADERKDREKAHGMLADLEKMVAQQQGLFREEKAEYERQLTIAHQQAESAMKEANKDHKASVAHVEVLNKKLQQTKPMETENYWREEAARMQHQLQQADKYKDELEESRIRVTKLQQEQQAKDDHIKRLSKELEKKSVEIDKMTKKVKKFEEAGKAKKKKTSDGTSPQDCMEATDRRLAKTELLYNEASLESQELQKQLKKLTAQYKQLENDNGELQQQVEILKAHLKEQDKQLRHNEASTSDDSSQIKQQLQMQYDHGQMNDTNLGQYTNEGRAVRDVTKLPIRAAPPPNFTQNAILDFDDVTSDSASPRHPYAPLRASHPDALPSPNASGPSSMSCEENLSGNLPHVPATTMPGNYPQGPAGSVADRMQFEQYPQPRINPGVPQIQYTPQERSEFTNYNPPYGYQQQQLPFQQQQGYIGGSGQAIPSDSQYPSQVPNQQEQLLQRMHQQQKQQNQQYQLHQQQMQAQEHQQHAHEYQPAYPHPGMPNQEVPPNQQYDQAGLLPPSNVPYQPNLFSAIDCYTSGDTPTTPEGQNFVIAQQSSNSQPSTGSLVGIQKPVQSPRPHSDEVMLDGPKQDGTEKECHHGAQPKPQSDPFPNPSNETFELPISAHNEAPCETDPLPEIYPNESGGEGRFGNILQESIDKDIEHFAAEVRDNVSRGREHIVTNTDRPFDPNLVCPMCNKAFRIGEIQKFRAHVNQCEGTKKGGVNN